MADVRRRTAPTSSTEPKAASIKEQLRAEDGPTAAKLSSIKVTDILRILGGIALLNAALSYYITGDLFFWDSKPWFADVKQVKTWINGPLQLTESELLAYDGSDPSKPIYLALNGTIYDVTAGRNYYGPGGMYGFFSGHDAARAFITGCFQEDRTADMRGVEEMYVPKDDAVEDAKLTPGERKTRRERELRLGRAKVKQGIEHWEKLFRGETGKPYFKVGEVKREKNWLERTPRRELCEPAQQKRPERKKEGQS